MLRGNVAAVLDVVTAGVQPVQDERGHADRRQDMADVDQGIHTFERDDRAGAGPEPAEGAEPGAECRIVRDTRRHVGEPVDVAPGLVNRGGQVIESAPRAPRQ